MCGLRTSKSGVLDGACKGALGAEPGINELQWSQWIPYLVVRRIIQFLRSDHALYPLDSPAGLRLIGFPPLKWQWQVRLFKLSVLG